MYKIIYNAFHLYLIHNECPIDHFSLPWSETASMAFLTVFSSSKNFIEIIGWKSSSNVYSNGMPVGKFKFIIASSVMSI